MVSGGRDSRRVEQQEETSGGRNVTRIAGRRQRGSQPQSLVDAVLVNLPHIQCPYDLEDRTRNELSPVPTRQPPGQEKVMGSILLTSKMELQGASDICTAHTTKLRNPLLRCPSDTDKFLLCEPMRSADRASRDHLRILENVVPGGHCPLTFACRFDLKETSGG
ncbi:uncharacterized protein LOC117092439 isoform X3 [Trachypithecus francoisi]|uniref:uncharacterized protein LOC117092439 isoform X3 n=1 Tax=Trachypithecus francoisi TaxID=54180 RepID=UPI00141B52C7|nr:uncharacterized protein LOC117092439 isoform X3 [Trachypithecus francoisi]